MLRNADDLGHEYKVFLANLEQVCGNRLVRASERHPGRYLELQRLLADVLGTLSNETGVAAMREAAKAEEREDPHVIDCLTRELSYFNRLVEDEYAQGSDEAVEVGKTIKDSVEKLIGKLPKPLKRLLAILNELLSFVKLAG